VVCYNFALLQLQDVKVKKIVEERDVHLRRISGGQTTESLLITPIQRLPRYELFLSTLLKQTHSLHPDYSLLKRALQEVKELNVRINEDKREFEQREAVFQVQERIHMEGDLVKEGRKFVMEGTMWER